MPTSSFGSANGDGLGSAVGSGTGVGIGSGKGFGNGDILPTVTLKLDVVVRFPSLRNSATKTVLPEALGSVALI